jgi:hypothetical protein
MGVKGHGLIIAVSPVEVTLGHDIADNDFNVGFHRDAVRPVGLALRGDIAGISVLARIRSRALRDHCLWRLPDMAEGPIDRDKIDRLRNVQHNRRSRR